MSFDRPENLARAFARAWGARDVATLAGFFAEDGELLSLTGGSASGRAEIAELFAGELAGAFARARLVTGRMRMRPVGAQAAVVLQRFVLSGLVNPDGSDAGRIGALLAATLEMTGEGWQIVAAQFVPESA